MRALRLSNHRPWRRSGGIDLLLRPVRLRGRRERALGSFRVARNFRAGRTRSEEKKGHPQRPEIRCVTEQSLSNALRLEQYIQDAENDGDSELADFFRRAQAASRKGGEEGKRLLKARID